MIAAFGLLGVGGCGDDGGTSTPSDGGMADRGVPDGAAGDAGSAPVSIPLAANPSADQCGAPAGATLANAEVAEGHCAWTFAEDLSDPRGIVVDASGDVLVVERGADRITALYDDDANRVSDPGERAVLVPSSRSLQLNHGIWIHDGYLYASSMTTMYRWPYTAGERADLGSPEVVVHDMPSGGHQTRTPIAKAGDHFLYVSIGSGSNVDSDSHRARIMRYDLDSIPSVGYDWVDGELAADGLRNEVGLAFDAQGRLWGVQNGMDNVMRDDLGGDIHDDNPAEEVNLFDQMGAFHGYPYCWTEYSLPASVGMGPGTQWAHELFIDDGTHDDAWCQDPTNVTPPRLAMQAHSAPLGMVFYEGDGLAPEVAGDAFVTFHGSWNRSPATGYEVVRLLFDGPNRIDRYEPFLQYAGPGASDAVEWPHRPVGLGVAADGALLVTSDASDVVIAVARMN